MIKIKTDSRKVEPGDTFVAIKGSTNDGHDFIESAIERGAIKIVASSGQYSVPTLLVEDTKKWLDDYLEETYREELKKLTFLGVTGTNGKTTTCFLTYQMLRALKVDAAYIGTIGYYHGDYHEQLENTTPPILDLYSLFIKAIEEGANTIVMEVSSHALDLGRIKGIKFKSVAFTNLTEDHLDYHKTMENYLKAKLKIFDYLKDDALVIVNADDQYSKYFEKNNYKTLGFNATDLKIENYEDSFKGTTINFTKDGKKYSVDTNLRAKFNVYNYLTSVLLVESLEFDIKDILKLSNQIKAPRGRCERVNYNSSDIIIDYAHTPDAVEKIIDSFKTTKKIITIIGCGGDRDPYKRPIMGKIATENSDKVIFTSDNPRTEDPKKIIDDILKGVTRDNYSVEPDRIKAIHLGIDELDKDSALLILGKGHEDYQIIGRTKYHMDDLEIVGDYIGKK